MKKTITLNQLRRLNAHVANGEISASKMVAIINERAKVANEKAKVININYFDKYRYEAELNQILHNDILKLKKQIELLKEKTDIIKNKSVEDFKEKQVEFLLKLQNNERPSRTNSR